MLAVMFIFTGWCFAYPTIDRRNNSELFYWPATFRVHCRTPLLCLFEPFTANVCFNTAELDGVWIWFDRDCSKRGIKSPETISRDRAHNESNQLCIGLLPTALQLKMIRDFRFSRLIWRPTRPRWAICDAWYMNSIQLGRLPTWINECWRTYL